MKLECIKCGISCFPIIEVNIWSLKCESEQKSFKTFKIIDLELFSFMNKFFGRIFTIRNVS